jgi:hypothetical protein
VVSGNRFQGLEPSVVNVPDIDPASQHWRAMKANADATLNTYRAGSRATRKETRRVLDLVLQEVEQQSLEGQTLAYLIGRLDEVDAERDGPGSMQSE